MKERILKRCPRPHRDDDDAGLSDDVLGELVEAGVGVVVEVLQLLHHVVQVQERPQGLSVQRGVDRRRVELQDGVVLTQRLLDKLRQRRRRVSPTCCVFALLSHKRQIIIPGFCFYGPD